MVQCFPRYNFRCTVSRHQIIFTGRLLILSISFVAVNVSAPRTPLQTDKYLEGERLIIHWETMVYQHTGSSFALRHIDRAFYRRAMPDGCPKALAKSLCVGEALKCVQWLCPNLAMDEIERFIGGYPPPRPSEKLSTEIQLNSDFTYLDRRAAEAPENLIHDFDDLLAYLLKDVTSDLAKVRAIFVWLASQEVVTRQFPKVSRPNTPQAFMKKIKFDRTYYAELFAVLCRKAGVPCVIIEGTSKGAGFEVGQKELAKNTNRWNAVHLEGFWRLINVSWALITTDGLAEGDMELIDQDGKSVRESEVSQKKVEHDLDEFWYLTDPGNFAAFLHPNDHRWQLLEKPWTDEEFLIAPRYAEDFFLSDWELISPYTGVLHAKGGKCQIVFSHPQDVSSASLRHNLYFNSKLSPKPLHEAKKPCVTVESKLGQKSLVIRLRQEGVYKVEVAGVLDGLLTGLGEFRIECTDIREESQSFPEGCESIGYNEVAAAAGLVDPSHEEGIVEANPGEKVELRVKFDPDQPRPQDIRAKLTHHRRTEKELSKNIAVIREENGVKVNVQVPTNDSFCEYGVVIDARVPTRDLGDNQSTDIDYTNVLNYIITQDKQLKFPEQRSIIQHKSELFKAIENFDVSRFNQALSTMTNIDPVTRGKIAAFLDEIMKLKKDTSTKLAKAMKGSDIIALEQVLEDYEQLGNVNQDIVKQARACLNLLRALKRENNDAESLEKVLKQVHDVQLTDNSNIQKAEDLLISLYEKDMCEAFKARTWNTLHTCLQQMRRSCLSSRVTSLVLFRTLEDLCNNREEAKRLTDKIGQLTHKDWTGIAGKRGKEPHPHIKSIFMATFILLGEREQELWKWETIQNLLERRSSLFQNLEEVKIDGLSKKVLGLAEGHLRECRLDVVTSENPHAALFLQWMQGRVKESRLFDEVNGLLEQINSKN